MANSSQPRPEPQIALAELLDHTAVLVAAVVERKTEPPRYTDPTAQLRTRLAVRGWVNPHQLMDAGTSPDTTAAALDAVAGEVDTSFGARSGEWYLSVPSRRRVLATRGAGTLRAELEISRSDADRGDAVRLAFRDLLGLDPAVPFAHRTEEQLRALANAQDWLGPLARRPIVRAEILAELARRRHAADIARMTTQDMVGREHAAALDQITAKLARAFAPGWCAIYLHGAGGTGKSTLLAFLERRLRASLANPVIVRIDLDDPLVNPADPISMDLRLFEQLNRDMPDIAAQTAARIATLSSIRRLQREDSGTGPTNPRRRRASATRPSTSLESIYSSAKSDRDSILYGVLSPLSAARRPLVLILDTAELVVTQGDTAQAELVAWVRSLNSALGAPDVRLVIAGRDPPGEPGSQGLFDRLRAITPDLTIIRLEELDLDAGMQLLANDGVSDPAAARAAATVVPRNPLLLRITADALTAHPELADEARRAHRANAIDSHSADTYLARRIVAHLADPVARPYLLAAMYVPEVTRSVLGNVIIPVIDNAPVRADWPRKADRVLRALRGARWLSVPGPGGRTVAFQRDVRALTLRLLAARSDEDGLRTRVHEQALAYHATRTPTQDRAYAFYHQAMLGRPLAVPRNPSRIAHYLRNVLDDLPPEARALLQLDRRAAATAQFATRSVEEWRLHLEGEGERGGEGDRLLDRDHPERALALYRDRPTRPVGAPPTFVIRALADLGEWDGDEVDIEAILDLESKHWITGKRLGGRDISRIYWLTRFALVRDKACLSHRHAQILEAICLIAAGRRGLTTLPAIVAVAEAGLGRSILTERMRHAKGGIESETRIQLVASHLFRRPFDFQPHVDALAVIQRDWTDRLRATAGNMLDVSLLDWVQERINALHGRPIAEMNLTLRELRKAIRVRGLGTAEARVLLLRGTTTEFLRPLRQVLVELHRTDLAASPLPFIADRLTGHCSILPVELESGSFAAALARDDAAWSTALVGFVDRARLLPMLCETLLGMSPDTPGVAKAHRVARAFLAWDLAICDGGASNWIETAPGGPM